jgi:cytochrome c oxidase subunit 2
LQNNAPTTKASVRRPAFFAAIPATALYIVSQLLVPQSASAAPLWPDPPQSPGTKIAFVLFVLVFAVGLLALIGYTLSLREAARSDVDADAPAAPDPGAKSAVITGVIVFLVLAVAGSLGFAKTTNAESSKGTPGPFFKVETFNQPGLKVVNVLKAPKGPAYRIRVNAQQFLWRYQYSGIKAAWNTYSYNDLILPSGVTVLLDFTSSDVEAAWWVPALGGSVTAMPGYNNQIWVRADKLGAFEGAGTVVNGTNYANMRTKVTVVPPAVFSRWVLAQQLQIDGAMTRLGRERTSGIEDKLLTGEELTAAESNDVKQESSK